MKELMERLEDGGCDVKATMIRLLDDVELYKTCLCEFIKDKGFDDLGIALKKGETLEALDCAHMLKGVAANLGIIPILNILIEINEQLKCENCDNMMPKYKKLIDEKEKLTDLVSK